MFVCFWTGFQIEAFNNPADFFMDVTNGEAKSNKVEAVIEGRQTKLHFACCMFDVLKVRGHVEVEVKLS